MKRKKEEDMEVEEEIAKATRDVEKTARAVVVEAAETTKSSTDPEALADRKSVV